MEPRFSDRTGITKPSQEVIQVNGMTESLRNSLWNYLFKHIFRNEIKGSRFIEYLWEYYWKRPLDNISVYPLMLNQIKEVFLQWDWYEIYNLIEFVLDKIFNFAPIAPITYQSDINNILEREMSGYRFIDGHLAPISNPEESQSINTSLQLSEENEFSGTKQHLDTAISLLSQKPNPDYRNSIKESISAVESLVKQITGEKGGGLEKALRKLDEKVGFHEGFKAGLLKLYGYTSDGDGIRHAILKEPNIGFDEAKYMLVMCSAFVNFIISKVKENGISR